MQKLHLTKLTVSEKIGIIIKRYKKKGYTTFKASDMSKLLDVTPQRMGNLLKQEQDTSVNYNRKTGEWMIL